jgi:hypothetical protein
MKTASSARIQRCRHPRLMGTSVAVGVRSTVRSVL